VFGYVPALAGSSPFRREWAADAGRMTGIWRWQRSPAGRKSPAIRRIALPLFCSPDPEGGSSRRPWGNFPAKSPFFPARKEGRPAGLDQPILASARIFSLQAPAHSVRGKPFSISPEQDRPAFIYQPFL